MAYREKIAWGSLLGMALTFGTYFGWVAITEPDQTAMPNFPMMMTYAVAALGYAVFTGAMYLVLRLSAPEDARQRADERDLSIERRSMQAGYWVLLFGMILVGGIMPFTNRGWEIVNTGIAAIVLAEVVRCVTMAMGYRRSGA